MQLLFAISFNTFEDSIYEILNFDNGDDNVAKTSRFDWKFQNDPQLHEAELGEGISIFPMHAVF